MLTVGTLLRAADVDLDKMSVSEGESLRNSGVIIFVFLDYQNSLSINPFNKETRYTIHAEMMKDTEYKAVQTVYTKHLENERVKYDRHGVHFVFIQTGSLVKFNFQVLLLSFVSGMGLIAVSTTIVDFIGTKLLGSKAVVNNLKYRTTANLSQLTRPELLALADKLRRLQEEELTLWEREHSPAPHADAAGASAAADSVTEDEPDVQVTLREPLVDRAHEDD